MIYLTSRDREIERLASLYDYVPVSCRCSDLQTKIHTITNGEYATAKSDVDRLRQELGQTALPSIQATLEEKSAQ